MNEFTKDSETSASSKCPRNVNYYYSDQEILSMEGHDQILGSRWVTMRVWYGGWCHRVWGAGEFRRCHCEGEKKVNS